MKALKAQSKQPSGFSSQQKIRHFAYVDSRKKLDNKPCHNKS